MSKKLKDRLLIVYEWVWETPLENIKPKLRPMLAALRIGHLIIRDLLEGQLTLRSMGLVYTTLLAMVPLLAVSFSVLKGFGVHNQLEPIMLNLLAPLGDKGVEITHTIIGFVDNIKVGVLGSLGLVLLFYTVVSLIQKIERAFNYTWRVSDQRPIMQRFSDYLSVILIGPVLVFSAIGMTASVSNVAVVKEAMDIEVVSMLFTFFSRLIPYLLIILAFTLIYMFVPNTKVKFKSALIGGIVSGILWETSGWVFASFIVNSTKYTAIYSAFATLIVFMIWLYLSWLILLVGGSIAFYHQHPEHRNLQSRILSLSNRMREKVSLLIMALIGQHYYHNKPAWTMDALAKKTNVGVEAIGLLIENLIKANLLVKTEGESPGYLPAHAPETIKVTDLLKSIRQAGESANLRIDNLPQVDVIDDLYNEIEVSINNSLAERNLHDLSLSDKDTAV